jgi:hypothetical protein
VLGRRHAPFPYEAVEDLRGVVRALYIATPAEQRVRRRKLAAIGQSLTIALELAVEGRGRIGERAAWNRAEDAVEALGLLVTMIDSAEPMVRAAMGRVRRR